LPYLRQRPFRGLHRANYLGQHASACLFGCIMKRGGVFPLGPSHPHDPTVPVPGTGWCIPGNTAFALREKGSYWTKQRRHPSPRITAPTAPELQALCAQGPPGQFWTEPGYTPATVTGMGDHADEMDREGIPRPVSLYTQTSMREHVNANSQHGVGPIKATVKNKVTGRDLPNGLTG
jgi:hypothetical protein